MNPQSQCPLFRLPAEIRSEIYLLTLISPQNPLIDPTIDKDAVRSKYKSMPQLGASLLSTCRRIHNEIDIWPLYALNEFVFTQPAYCWSFLAGIPEKNKSLVTTITLDLRENIAETLGNTGGAAIDSLNEWSHFLTCSYPDHPNEPRNLYCRRPAPQNISAHVPPIRTIVFDL